VNDESPATPRSTGRRGLIVALVVVLVAGLGAWRGWAWWQARQAATQDAAADAVQRIAALESRVELLRSEQRKQAQRLQDAAATNRILRDEVLGLGQRGALLEETVARLADPDRHGAQALRLDEVEMLLSQAAQRLAIAHDIEGAKRAYALAGGMLDGVDDHRLLNLKQALAQERSALDALGPGPQAEQARQLDALALAVAGLARAPSRAQLDASAPRPAWQRMLAPLVDVRPTRDATLIAPAERTAAEAALQVEFSLARAALERGSDADYRAALARIGAWLAKLWPDSPALHQAQGQLKAMEQTTAPPDPAILGSTLQQLRVLRGGGLRLPAAPATREAPVAP